jgi:hypothetical protein
MYRYAIQKEGYTRYVSDFPPARRTNEGPRLGRRVDTLVDEVVNLS